MNTRTGTAVCFVVFLLFVISCTRKQLLAFKDMGTLRNALIKEYKEDDVSVSIQNGNSLNVSFVNSSFEALSKTAKQRKAEEIARFVNSHYASIKNIWMISVSFVVYKDYIIFDYTNRTNNFYFQKDGLIVAADTT